MFPNYINREFGAWSGRREPSKSQILSILQIPALDHASWSSMYVRTTYSTTISWFQIRIQLHPGSWKPTHFQDNTRLASMKKAERHLNQGKDFIIFSDDKRNVGILAHNGCQSVAQTKFAHGHLPKDFCPIFFCSIEQDNRSKRQMPKEKFAQIVEFQCQ